jgi:hypothetical protein
MLINNFDLISSLFYFRKEQNMFFHCQIVKRAKDHKNEKVKEGVISAFYITSADHLASLKDEIIQLCECFGARAYINVAGKTFWGLKILLLSKLAEDIKNSGEMHPKKLLNSAAGELKPHDKRWVVDIDDITIKSKVEQKLIELYSVDLVKQEYPFTEATIKTIRYYNIIAEVPTRYGIHLIVKPFNTKLFSEAFPNIDIHKNSMGTLLYYPSCLK